MNYLLQPKKYQHLLSDAGSRVFTEKTIDFFENIGKTQLTDDFHKKVWYRNFVNFVGREQIFAK